MSTKSLPIRVERRLERPPRWLAVIMPILSGIVALAIAAVVMWISGYDPIGTYDDMARQALLDPGAFSHTLVSATPLLFTGLAATVAFRMKAWNIGGEGQLCIGAICAAAAGIAVGDQGLAIALPAMLVAGILGGALWAAIPGVLRSYLNTNEVLTSLMLNYVAILLMYYLIFDSRSFLRDLSSPSALLFPHGKELDESAFWPGFTGGGVIVPLGFVLAVVIAVGLYIAIAHTRFGFQLRLVADSPDAGRYAGIHTKKLFVLVMVISGALAALGGVSQIGDFTHVLEPKGLEESAYGYTGIVAAALARFNPIGVIVSAVFLGGITNAGFNLQGETFPLGLVGTIEGTILFCVLGGEAILRYRVSRRRAPVKPDADGPEYGAVTAPAMDEPAGRTA